MVGETARPASPASVPIAAAGSPTPSSHPIQHVVVIYLENEGVSAVDKYGPYERYLGATYGNITEMYSACHPSMTNYIAAVAAVTNNCGSDNWYNYSNASLADLISGDQSNALTWAQFAENLPSGICANPDQNVGVFGVRHVPFLFFQNVTKNESYCKSHVLGSTYFNGTAGDEGITSTHFVNFSFYSPNICDDGHSTCGSVPAKCASISGSKIACQEVTQADVWLQGFLGARLNSSNPVEENNVNHTMFIVTWDEDGNPTTLGGYSVPGITSGNNYQACKKAGAVAGYAVCGGHIYGLVIDHYNRGVAPMSQPDAAYGIVATVEWLFNLQGKRGTGLDNYGEYDYLYQTTSPGFPTFASISGITDDGYGAGYTVTFKETGLPSGTHWSVTLNGTQHTSTTTTITFTEPNGNYSYTIADISGWHQKTLPYTGEVTVKGAAVTEPTLVFTQVTYSVTFTESGLPPGTEWWVNLTNRQTFSSTTDSLSFAEPNGSYSYTVATADKEYASSGGSFTVNGATVSRTVTFSLVSYTVTFKETGLPSGTHWSVTLNGNQHTSTTTTITFTEPNGNYSYAIADISGWHQTTLPYTGEVQVKGAAVTEPTLVFTQVTYSVTFTESGLPSGTEWWVNLTGGQTFSSTTDSLSFAEPNGTYNYTVATADKEYAPVTTSGSFGVSGASVGEAVAFNRGTYTVTFTETGLPNGTTWYVNGTAWGSLSATVAGILGTSVSADLTNGTYPFTVASANKTWAPAYTSPFVVNGGPVAVSVTFTEVTYAVTFTESGLPSGTSWSVTLKGTLNTSTTGTITFPEPNGTYSFTIGSASGYAANRSSGGVTVSGSSATEMITFSPTGPVPYAVTFTETGLPSGTSWSVTLSGTTHTSTTATVTFAEANGSYSYSIGAVTGYGSNPSNGSLTVSGAPLSIAVSFETVYALTFTESTLPLGTNWSVTLTGSSPSVILVTPLGSAPVKLTRWSDGASTIRFYVSNGSYFYSVSAPGNSNTTGSLTVSGATTAPVTVTFPSSSSSSSSLPMLDYVIIGVVVVVVAIGLVVVWGRNRGGGPSEPEVPPSRPSSGGPDSPPPPS